MISTLTKTRPEEAADMNLYEPAWDVARLFPSQGMWSEDEYLALDTNQLIEFSHGRIEVLAMPTEKHQLIVLYLYNLLLAFTRQFTPGMVLVAPMRVRLWPGKFREPDVLFMLAEHAYRRHNVYWETPDLALEVVSEENRQHDLVTKRREYAQAGIPEYWIVDPGREQITVLTLSGETYLVHGEFGPGEAATSVLLPNLKANVSKVMAA